MDAKVTEAIEELETLGWWYQHFELPNGLWTGDGKEPGYLPQTRWQLIEKFVPRDLTGKSVLDLGGNAGYFSIQMKLRGAERCLLVDPYPEFLKQAEFASRQFGVSLDLVEQDAHTFCLTTEERFDYVLLLGLLYHLKYPGIVLDRAAEMTKHRLYLASNVIGPDVETKSRADYARYGEDESLLAPGHPQLAFVEERFNNDATNWWLPNYAVLPAMLRSAGMNVIERPHAHVLVAEPERYLGKTVYPKLVFPNYGKPGEAVLHPGPQRIDPELWATLEKMSADFRRRRLNPAD